MSTDRLATNKEVARRIILDVIDHADMALADRLVAPDYVEHRPSDDPDAKGLDGLKTWIRTVHQAFPDWRHVIQDEVADGDLVTIRSTLYGTHRGAWMGIPPTGNTIEQRGYDQFRIVDGRMVEHWGEYDWIGFYQQLGALPEDVKRKLGLLPKDQA
jgi:predicted ester cyclase